MLFTCERSICALQGRRKFFPLFNQRGVARLPLIQFLRCRWLSSALTKLCIAVSRWEIALWVVTDFFFQFPDAMGPAFA